MGWDPASRSRGREGRRLSTRKGCGLVPLPAPSGVGAMERGRVTRGGPAGRPDGCWYMYRVGTPGPQAKARREGAGERERQTPALAFLYKDKATNRCGDQLARV